MHLNSSSVRPVYIKSNDVIKNKFDNRLLRICYLSNLETLETLQAVNSEYVFETYTIAETGLARIVESNRQLPDAIILNLPYSPIELKGFINWVSSHERLKNVPIIYNKTALSDEELVELRSCRVVDDIIDLDIHFFLLSTKCQFLKQIKESREQHVNTDASDGSRYRIPTKVQVEHLVKRAIDIILTLILIIFLLPVFLIVALIIRIESKGPIIYASSRAGKGYKIFKFYKFRTMHTGADTKREELEKLNLYSSQQTGAKFFKIKNDPRITKSGLLLRNTSLDELPQLFNVLKGDMSLVGNRPLPLYEAATLTTNDWAERFMAPAGITGLWQITKRGKAEMSTEERISLDISYAQSHRLLQDLIIMAKTPTALFQKADV